MFRVLRHRANISFSATALFNTTSPMETRPKERVVRHIRELAGKRAGKYKTLALCDKYGITIRITEK